MWMLSGCTGNQILSKRCPDSVPLVMSSKATETSREIRNLASALEILNQTDNYIHNFSKLHISTLGEIHNPGLKKNRVHNNIHIGSVESHRKGIFGSSLTLSTRNYTSNASVLTITALVCQER